MLSFVELQRAVQRLDALVAGHRLQAVMQPDDVRLVLTVHGHTGDEPSRRRHVLLCGAPDAARVSLLERPPKALPAPPALTQYLRAHAIGSRVAGVRLAADDRLVAVDLDAHEGRLCLLLQILGRRSNVYLLDATERVVAALRPLDVTRQELRLGEPWRAPESKVPRRGEDRFAAEPDERLLEAIEESYGAAAAEGELSTLQRSVGQALRRAMRRLDRKLAKLTAELEAAEAATELARHGELLKGALGQVGRGDSAVTVRDPESGEEVSIALDPAKSPSQNLEAIFKRYQKAVRRLTRGGAQDDAVREARARLAKLEDAFAAVGDDAEALRAFAEQPDVAELVRKSAPASPSSRSGRAAQAPEVKLGKRSVPRRLAPRRYPTAGGLEIWVGRSDSANDFLSTRLARGKDLFFHLDGAPGSHVVLRTEGRPDPPSEAVLDACELAVHFSRAKNATRADVHIVPISNVRKPKGAKPGLVTVHGGRTLHLRRIPTRLERLLASRIED